MTFSHWVRFQVLRSGFHATAVPLLSLNVFLAVLDYETLVVLVDFLAKNVVDNVRLGLFVDDDVCDSACFRVQRCNR